MFILYIYSIQNPAAADIYIYIYKKSRSMLYIYIYEQNENDPDCYRNAEQPFIYKL